MGGVIAFEVSLNILLIHHKAGKKKHVIWELYYNYLLKGACT